MARPPVRITEREVLRQLAKTCAALGLPCAYTTDGVRRPHDELRTEVGTVTLDHQPIYGGARVHTYGPTAGAFGLCGAPRAFDGIATGMDKRQSLRKVWDRLRDLELEAVRA